MKKLLLLSLVSGVVSCGGGGGDSSGGDSFAGVWRGQVALSSDTCGTDAAPYLDSVMTVNQDGSLVVVDGPQGDTFSGTANSIDLKAEAQRNFDCGNGFAGLGRLKIDFLRGQGSGYQSDEVAAIYTITTECIGLNVGCTLKYLGTLERD